MDLLRQKMRLLPLSGPQDSGGGGGGGGTSTTVSDLPDWAKPTAQKTLAQAEAVTAPGVQYQPYDKNRIAGFQPLQQTAFTGAQNLAPSGLSTQAGGIAGLASLGALGTGYNPYQTGQFTGDVASQYMNPYLEQAMSPQIREATRQSEMMRNQQQAQAVQQGAFGGSRQAIVEAERQRNLGQQIGDIRGRGYASAFDQAQQQFGREQQLQEQSRQYGAGLGMQGLQTALQGAGMMGQLGGQQFSQAKDVIGLQSQMGAQQQALEQQKLSQDYQDFLAQKKFPYQQIEFMSNILRGTPMGTVQTQYAPGPTTAQTLGSLGMAAYGVGKMADGGLAHAYAAGGSVTDEQFVASALRRLSDAQLQQEVQEATQAKDQARLIALQEEVSRRSQMRSGAPSGVGLSSLFTEQMADRVLPGEDSMARGGIVAFADGDVVDDEEDDKDTTPAPVAQQGDEASYKGFLGDISQSIRDIRGAKYTPFSPAQRRAATSEYIKEMEAGLGTSPYETYRRQLEEMQGERAGTLSQGQGLAALQAASAMMQGRGLAQGLGRAAGAYSSAYGQALAADKAEKRALASMEFNLLDAQRKERMGLNRDARAAADQAGKAHDAAQMFAVKKAQALATAAGKGATASRPPVVKPPKPAAPPKVPEQLAAAEVAFEANPTEANRSRVTALRRAASQLRTSDVGPVRAAVDTFRTTSTADAALEKQVQEAKFTDPDWRAAYATQNPQAIAAAEDAIHKRLSGRRTPAPGTTAPAPAPAPAASVNTNSTRPANTGTVQGLPPGATVRGDQVFDSSGKLIGHVQ